MNKSFTLIEMLVCSLIVAVLTAAGAVYLGNVKSRSDRLKAENYAAQLNQCLATYVQVCNFGGSTKFRNPDEALPALTQSEILTPHLRKLCTTSADHEASNPSLDAFITNLNLPPDAITWDKIQQKFVPDNNLK